MFGFFRPSCPVDEQAKAWIERRLRWLSSQFGYDVFTRRAFILPTEEFFPDPYDRSEGSVRKLLDQVCGYMDVEPAAIKLELFTDRRSYELVNGEGHALGGVAGLYECDEDGFQATLRLELSQLDDPMCLVGTLAHELAHHRLLGEGRLSGEEFDNELLTDLTVVFHGMGVFPANLPRAWLSDFGYWPGTELRKPEYMTLPMYGYALAHAAWHRGEEKPAWARHLGWHARAALRQGLRFLRRSGDSRFPPRRRR